MELGRAYQIYTCTLLVILLAIANIEDSTRETRRIESAQRGRGRGSRQAQAGQGQAQAGAHKHIRSDIHTFLHFSQILNP